MIQFTYGMQVADARLQRATLLGANALTGI